MFNSLHSHVESLCFFLHDKAQCLEALFLNSNVACRTFLFKCVAALRISSRLSRLGDPGLFILREKLEQLQLHVLMQSSQRTQRLGTGEPVNIPADLDLDSLFVKDLRTLCSQLSLPTAGPRSALVERLKEAREEARRNAQPISAPPPVQNGGDGIELQQHFQQLQQQVQDLLNRNSNMTKECSARASRLKLNPWSKQPATRRSNRQRPQLPKLQRTPSLVLRRLLKRLFLRETRRAEGKVPSAVQETLNSTAVVGASGMISTVLPLHSRGLWIQYTNSHPSL